MPGLCYLGVCCRRTCQGLSVNAGGPLHLGEQPTASGAAPRPTGQHATFQQQAPAAVILAGLEALVAEQAAANGGGGDEGPSSATTAAGGLGTDGQGEPAAREAAWAAALCRALCALRKAGCIAIDEAAYVARRASRREVVRSRCATPDLIITRSPHVRHRQNAAHLFHLERRDMQAPSPWHCPLQACRHWPACIITK